jgi:hypothetical protein
MIIKLKIRSQGPRGAVEPVKQKNIKIKQAEKGMTCCTYWEEEEEEEECREDFGGKETTRKI